MSNRIWDCLFPFSRRWSSLSGRVNHGFLRKDFDESGIALLNAHIGFFPSSLYHHASFSGVFSSPLYLLSSSLSPLSSISLLLVTHFWPISSSILCAILFLWPFLRTFFASPAEIASEVNCISIRALTCPVLFPTYTRIPFWRNYPQLALFTSQFWHNNGARDS